MKQFIVLKRHISVSQKFSGSAAKFGEGFNYSVEATFPLEDYNPEAASEALKNALAKVDHKALGLDVDLGFEPTSPALCAFLAREIVGLSFLRLVRGDGATFEV